MKREERKRSHINEFGVCTLNGEKNLHNQTIFSIKSHEKWYTYEICLIGESK